MYKFFVSLRIFNNIHSLLSVIYCDVTITVHTVHDDELLFHKLMYHVPSVIPPDNMFVVT